MKKKAFALICIMISVVLTLGGCADFAFNPIGRWSYAGERIYTDGVMEETAAEVYGISSVLVFRKSGTGYIDTGAKNNPQFTYEYDDKEVRVTYSSDESEAETVVYNVLENGQELVILVNEADLEDAGGKTRHYRVESVFKRTK